eukprot:Clim_evm12s155 gene=Clim_evmTU12s155
MSADMSDCPGVDQEFLDDFFRDSENVNAADILGTDLLALLEESGDEGEVENTISISSPQSAMSPLNEPLDSGCEPEKVTKQPAAQPNGNSAQPGMPGMMPGMFPPMMAPNMPMPPMDPKAMEQMKKAMESGQMPMMPFRPQMMAMMMPMMMAQQQQNQIKQKPSIVPKGQSIARKPSTGNKSDSDDSHSGDESFKAETPNSHADHTETPSKASSGGMESHSLGSGAGNHSGDEDGKNDDGAFAGLSKKEVRRMKNREAATRSRLQKKAYMENLEKRLKAVQTENKKLKQQLEESRSENNMLKRQLDQVGNLDEFEFDEELGGFGRPGAGVKRARVALFAVVSFLGLAIPLSFGGLYSAMTGSGSPASSSELIPHPAHRVGRSLMSTSGTTPRLDTAGVVKSMPVIEDYDMPVTEPIFVTDEMSSDTALTLFQPDAVSEPLLHTIYTNTSNLLRNAAAGQSDYEYQLRAAVTDEVSQADSGSYLYCTAATHMFDSGATTPDGKSKLSIVLPAYGLDNIEPNTTIVDNSVLILDTVIESSKFVTMPETYWEAATSNSPK